MDPEGRLGSGGMDVTGMGGHPEPLHMHRGTGADRGGTMCRLTVKDGLLRAKVTTTSTAVTCEGCLAMMARIEEPIPPAARELLECTHCIRKFSKVEGYLETGGKVYCMQALCMAEFFGVCKNLILQVETVATERKCREK